MYIYLVLYLFRYTFLFIYVFLNWYINRICYFQGLIEAQDEIAELRKKFKIMGHQIEQLKEEITVKDQVRERQHKD